MKASAIFLLLTSALYSTTTCNAFTPISTTNSLQINTKLHSWSSSLAASTTRPTKTPITKGLSKTILQPGNPNEPLQFGDVATLSYNVYTPTTKSTIAKSPKQKFIIGENSGVMIEGWEQGLSTMNVGERSIIHVEDAEKFGYGKEGIPPILGSMEVLDMEIEVLEKEEQSRFGAAMGSGMVGGDVSAISGMTGSGELGALDPMKPVSS